MLDWNNYRSELMQRLGELGKLTPETMKGVVALGNAGNKTDLLGAKVRELIALACAVTTAATAVLLFTPTPL
jgi:alkylhydroperoxidase/carboxymuconolactone decarboxylase family protein YurZ